MIQDLWNRLIENKQSPVIAVPSTLMHLVNIKGTKTCVDAVEKLISGPVKITHSNMELLLDELSSELQKLREKMSTVSESISLSVVRNESDDETIMHRAYQSVITALESECRDLREVNIRNLGGSRNFPGKSQIFLDSLISLRSDLQAFQTIMFKSKPFRMKVAMPVCNSGGINDSTSTHDLFVSSVFTDIYRQYCIRVKMQCFHFISFYFILF